MRLHLPGWLLATIDRVQHIANLQNSKEQDLEVFVHPQRITSFNQLADLSLSRRKVGIKSKHADRCKDVVIDQQRFFFRYC